MARDFHDGAPEIARTDTKHIQQKWSKMMASEISGVCLSDPHTQCMAYLPLFTYIWLRYMINVGKYCSIFPMDPVMDDVERFRFLRGDDLLG